VGSGPPGPAETSLLEVVVFVVFVVPFLPIAAAIYLGFRLRAHLHTPQAAPAV
jgi:hypothetical protein